MYKVQGSILAIAKKVSEYFQIPNKWGVWEMGPKPKNRVHVCCVFMYTARR